MQFSTLRSFTDGSGQIQSGNFIRAGCMVAFNSFEHFQQYSDEILDILEDYMSPSLINAKTLEAVEGEVNADDRRLSTSINVSMSDSSVKPLGVDGETKCK